MTTLLIAGAALLAAAPAAAKYTHKNISRAMAAAANPNTGYGARLRHVRSILAQPAKGVPKATRLSALLVERSLMRAVIDAGGDSRMHGFTENSISDAVTAYGSGPFTRANRVHRQAADLFKSCATRQIEHLDAYARRAMEGDSQGYDPVQYLQNGLKKMNGHLGSSVAKAQGQEWQSWAQAQMKQVQGYIKNGSLAQQQRQPKPEPGRTPNRVVTPVDLWLGMWGLRR
jgi:hypothetical protein